MRAAVHHLLNVVGYEGKVADRVAEQPHVLMETDPEDVQWLKVVLVPTTSSPHLPHSPHLPLIPSLPLTSLTPPHFPHLPLTSPTSPHLPLTPPHPLDPCLLSLQNNNPSDVANNLKSKDGRMVITVTNSRFCRHDLLNKLTETVKFAQVKPGLISWNVRDVLGYPGMSRDVLECSGMSQVMQTSQVWQFCVQYESLHQ